MTERWIMEAKMDRKRSKDRKKDEELEKVGASKKWDSEEFKKPQIYKAGKLKGWVYG